MGRVGLIALMAAAAWILQPSPLSDVVLPAPANSGVSASVEVVQSVEPAEPVRIVLPTLGVDALMYPGGVDTDTTGRLDPPDNQPAWWVRTALPGLNSSGTTMILGHNLGDGTTPFSDLATLQPGEEVDLWTKNGEIRYRVEEVVSIGRRALPDDDRLMADVPGRLLLVTCRTEGAAATLDNVVVVAQQVGLVS